MGTSGHEENIHQLIRLQEKTMIDMLSILYRGKELQYNTSNVLVEEKKER